jgi:glycyl-tRNA synthetase
MVEVIRVQETIRGEWFLPHVVEPAFGLDRIIWHLLDHGYEMTSKEGEEYLILHLSESVAPYEVVVLPLFEKDGMGEIAKELQIKLLEINRIGVYYDGSRSIGRRYARADEIGVPWAVTIDYESLEDGSVTVRRRDDQSQIRVSTDDLVQHLQNGSVASVF